MVKTINSIPADLQRSCGLSIRPREDYLQLSKEDKAIYDIAIHGIAGISGCVHEGDYLLNIGCGISGLSQLSNAVGTSGKVVGVDICPKDIQIAKEIIKNLDLGNVEVYFANACDLYEGDSEIYDTVIISEVLHTLPTKYASAVLDDASKLCKTNLYVSALASDLQDIILGEAEESRFGESWKKEFFVKEAAFYSGKEIVSEIQSRGFSTEIYTIPLNQVFPISRFNDSAYLHHIFAKKIVLDIII